MLDAIDYAAIQVQQNPRHVNIANAVNADLFWTTFDRLGPIDGTWPAVVEPANLPLGYDAAQFVRYALTGSTEGRSPASWLVQVPNEGQFYVYVRANAGESSDENLRISVDDVVVDTPNARLHINDGPDVLDWFYVGKVSFSDATPSWIDLSLGGKTYDAIVRSVSHCTLSRAAWCVPSRASFSLRDRRRLSRSSHSRSTIMPSFSSKFRA